MRNVSGHYFDKRSQAVKFSVDVAGSWNELNPHQLATILQVLHYKKADRYVIASSLLSLLFQRHWHILANLLKEELHELMPLTDFVMDTPPPSVNPFPVLKLRRKLHYAPAEDLSNITFGEWCFAYQAWQYYTVYKDESFLNKLIALLYRQLQPGQNPKAAAHKVDIRQPFNETLIELHAMNVRDIEQRFKLAVYAWFTAALMQVMEFRPHVFPKTEPVPEEEQQPEAIADPSDRNWFTVFRELLGPKWGTSDQLKSTNAMFILDALEEMQIEYKAAQPTS